MMRTGWNCYCFFCALVCAILKLTSATTDCSVTNNQTNIHQITCYVSENVPPNTLVFDAKEDNRFSDTSKLQFQVHITGFESAFAQHFVVNKKQVPWMLDNGELRTQGDFDREKMFGALSDSQNSRDTIMWPPLLVIRRNQGRNRGVVWKFQLYIKVVDVNDNTPTFPHSTTVIENNEGDGNNVNFTRFLFTAIDNDEQHNSVQDYTLQDDYGGLFTLVVRVGPVVDTVRLESTSPLDYETQSRYYLIVIARDGGNQTGTLNVTLIVLDTNDNRPVVGITQYDVAVMENLNSGHPVIDINATDADSGDFGTLKYSMRVQNDIGSDVTSANIFFINQTTGEILTNTVLDHEDVKEYHLVVTIRDCGDPPNSVIVKVDVEVIDTNDNPPVVRVDLNDSSPVVETPPFVEMPLLVEMPPVVIQENLIGGHPVIDINATDADGNSTLTYSMRVQSNKAKDITGTFVINQTTGEIRTNRVLDRELVPNYHLIVTIKDGGKSSNSVGVLVNVEVSDINDSHPKVNIKLISGKVCENTTVGTSIATMTVSDPDEGANGMFTVGALVDLDVVDGSQSQIELQQSPQNNKWDLVVASSLDKNARQHYKFEITVVDHGSPPLSTTKMFSFRVRRCRRL